MATPYSAALARLDALSGLERAALHRLNAARATHTSAASNARYHHRATHALQPAEPERLLLAAAGAAVPLQRAEHDLAEAQRVHTGFADERTRLLAALPKLREAA
jgi:hypothetical protein